MSATAADIARFTTDGIVVASPSAGSQTAILTLHPAARLGTEQTTFFDNAADAQTMLDEKASYVTATNRIHVGIAVDDSLPIGTTIPIAPTVPAFRVVDGQNNIDLLCRCRSIATDFDQDQYAIEVVA